MPARYTSVTNCKTIATTLAEKVVEKRDRYRSFEINFDKNFKLEIIGLRTLIAQKTLCFFCENRMTTMGGCVEDGGLIEDLQLLIHKYQGHHDQMGSILSFFLSFHLRVYPKAPISMIQY